MEHSPVESGYDDKPGKWNAEAAAIHLLEDMQPEQSVTADQFIDRIVQASGVDYDTAREVFFDFCERRIILYDLKTGVTGNTWLQ